MDKQKWFVQERRKRVDGNRNDQINTDLKNALVRLESLIARRDAGDTSEKLAREINAIEKDLASAGEEVENYFSQIAEQARIDPHSSEVCYEDRYGNRRPII